MTQDPIAHAAGEIRMAAQQAVHMALQGLGIIADLDESTERQLDHVYTLCLARLRAAAEAREEVRPIDPQILAHRHHYD